jgi:hypothetical protein
VNATRALKTTRNEAYEDRRGTRGEVQAPGVVLILVTPGKPDQVINPLLPVIDVEPVVDAEPPA